MTRSWMHLPENERQPASFAQSFFVDYQSSCEQMVSRWHSGQSSHPDARSLAEEYPNTPEGVNMLYQDIGDLQNDPGVADAEMVLRNAMYTAEDPDSTGFGGGTGEAT